MAVFLLKGAASFTSVSRVEALLLYFLVPDVPEKSVPGIL